MKFTYIDESGTGDEPYAVMVGVVVDAQRMRPTKDNWDSLLSSLSEITGREVKEFHTKDFYAGNGIWRGLPGGKRAEIITAIVDWFCARGHSIFYSAIDRQRYDVEYADHAYTKSLGSLWKVLAFHLSLSIQRSHQKFPHPKGNTVLIFDAHKRDEEAFSELILDPPEWAYGYFLEKKQEKRLDQIIDVPHFVDSRHVGMIQLADCVSFILRRQLELEDGGKEERYDGEADIISKWATSIIQQCKSKPSIYPKVGRSEAAEYFYQLAPDSLRIQR